MIVDEKQYLAIDNLNPKLILNEQTDETNLIASFNNVIYEYNNLSANDQGQLVCGFNFNLANKTSYGIIDKIVISSEGKFDISFMKEYGDEVLDFVENRSGSISPTIDCGYFKITGFETNQVIDNILVYYKPISSLKYQIDDQDNYRLVAQLKDLRNGKLVLK